MYSESYSLLKYEEYDSTKEGADKYYSYSKVKHVIMPAGSILLLLTILMMICCYQCCKKDNGCCRRNRQKHGPADECKEPAAVYELNLDDLNSKEASRTKDV